MRIQIFTLLLCIGTIFSCKNETHIPKDPSKFINFEPTKAAELATKIRETVVVDISDDLELSLWASDSLVSDPIAISIDPKGQIYYTSATRQSNSEFDVRGHQDWITASISFQTVEDRRAFLRKTFEADNEESTRHLKDLNKDGVRDWRDLAVEKERIWLVSDQSKDGVADQAQLYLEDFGEEITDVANGVEYAFGEVYVSVGPDLWKTKDIDNNGSADETTSLSHGYAIHIGFSGHGMSGVTMGPDGRIWWGIGDIGMNVVDQDGKHWKYPNRGVVVRSETDGSNFEVFAMGVRNTHEFVFDKFGNLITVDNDGDHDGERERLVYLIDGSDTGWRINWQFGKYTDPDNNSYKVWMDEKMHIPKWDGQAAYFLPAIQNYINGPTGMVYNPGTALSPKYYDHFFVSEFRGTPANSPIHAFTMAPDGAGFKLNKTEIIANGLLPTGLDFGPDGAMYFGDWINGWATKNEGRIWKLDVQENSITALRKETQQLIEKDFSNNTLAELESIMEAQDMRVRTKAQFELVNRGAEGFQVLEKTAKESSNLLARIHGLWGMGQMARKDNSLGQSLVPFLEVEHPEILAQAAKLLGDIRFKPANEKLIKLVVHNSPRVRFFAVEALGRIGEEKSIPAILDLLQENNDQDTWLRMGATIALGRIGKAEPLLALKNHPSKALRTAAVVALRRMEHEGIAIFLKDKEEYIAAEAARGINDDFSIEKALPALADILNKGGLTSEPLLRRAINANLRVGEIKNAKALLDFGMRKSAPQEMRSEAIAALSTWGNLSVFDRVDGRYRGEVKRDIQEVKSLADKNVNVLLRDVNKEVLISAIKLVHKFEMQEKAPVLLGFVARNPSKEVRVAALSALHLMGAEQLEKGLNLALDDKSSEVRSKAISIISKSKAPEETVVGLYKKILKNGSINEQQTTISALGKMDKNIVKGLLQDLLTELQQGKLKPETQLDLIVAIEENGDQELLARLDDYQKSKSADDPLAHFREAMYGGNRQQGNKIFYEHAGAQCTRCHAVFEYGGNAGPGLDGVGSRLTKEEILSSIITPSAEYALGYEIISMELKSNESVSGVVLEKTNDYVKIKLGKEDIKTIARSDIKSMESLPSSMLPMENVLSKKEIRDLVEFLAELKAHN